MAGDAESVVSMPQLPSGTGTGGADERAALTPSYTADRGDADAAAPADARGGCGSLFRPPPGADLPTKMVAAYGVGCFTMSMLVDLPSFYYSPFLLEVALMDPIYVGNLLLTCKIFDAFIDPFVGAMSDQTRHRMGRRRPWMTAAIPVAAVFNILMWHSWPGLIGNDGGQFAYYLLMFCLTTLGYTLFFIPYTALVTDVCSKDIDRLRLTSARTGNMIIGDMVAVGVVAVYMVIANGNDEGGYQAAAVVNSCIIVLMMTITITGVPEPSSASMPRKRVAEEIKLFFVGVWDLLRSWDYMSTALMGACGWLSIYFVQNNLYLFAKYSAEMPQLFDIVLMIALASCLVCVPMWYWFVTVLSKRQCAGVGVTWLLMTWIGLIFIPAKNIPLTMVLAVLSGGGIASCIRCVGAQVANLMPWVMLADVIDADELKHGYRREGLLSSFFVFINKVAIGLSLTISGYILSVGGYDNSSGTEPEPTPELNRTMRLLCGVLPAVFAFAIIPFVVFNPMTATRQREINLRIQQLRRREATQVAAAAATVSPSTPALTTDLSFAKGMV